MIQLKLFMTFEGISWSPFPYFGMETKLFKEFVLKGAIF